MQILRLSCKPHGTIVGTLIGALIVGIFRNGLQLMGIPSMYQVLITGILVILAVTVEPQVGAVVAALEEALGSGGVVLQPGIAVRGMR